MFDMAVLQYSWCDICLLDKHYNFVFTDRDIGWSLQVFRMSNESSIFEVVNGNSTSDTEWSAWLIVFQAFTVFYLVIALWVFGCVVIYGFKTRRWYKTPSASSLSNGMIYTTCTFAVFLLFPQLVTTLMLHIIRFYPRGNRWCEIVCDVTSITYTVFTYGTYFYLWMRQRLIYVHPYVKPHISGCMQWISKLYIIYITVTSCTIPVLYVYPRSYIGGQDGCYYHVANANGFLQSSGSNILFALVLTSQISLLILSIYPCFRVSFDKIREKGNRTEMEEFNTKESPVPKNETWCRCFQNLMLYVAGTEGPKSPIQMTVKRTVMSSAVIVITDVFVAIFEDYAIPDEAPTVIGEALYDLSSVINVFCILASFGFAGDILTLCCPTMKKPKTNYSIYRKPDGPDHV